MKKLAILSMLTIVLFIQNVEAQSDSYTLQKDVLFASPEGFGLTMDIYTPNTGKDSYPVVVIWHGGGWLINTNDIMDEMSQYLAEQGEFVVCNVNYRLLGDQNNTVTLDEIVEDVFGSLLWIKSNISAYKGDPNQIAVTGDSAGGHLAAMVVSHGKVLESDGFDGATFGFSPSWLPEGKTAEQVAAEDGLEVQAAIPSYGVFNMVMRAENGFETSQNGFWEWGGATPRGLFGEAFNVEKNPDIYEATSPIHNVSDTSEKKYPPMFFHVGSEDTTTPPEAIEAYVSKLKQAGQQVEYKVYEGKKHAYLDNGCNDYFQQCFADDAVPVLNDMITFLNNHLKRN
ncbi:MAG: alpha/beta hydrolase [Balneolaceae bacterium]|nr:alpha/beta hydrolase [Balneolaceae bacterium]